MKVIVQLSDYEKQHKEDEKTKKAIDAIMQAFRDHPIIYRLIIEEDY